ncbi:hypothetical protein BTM25_07120 [Actinomadura rubteroloni]|uniref:Uncharacterized protein n=1 Tax=Actinomadura rubteroloni TaxID=1926885 RepID=A0A2P4UMP4_9ACTN|nr:hypothetical protein [Actinomadura rubteroloni]POM26315.1 hypothetical protein BTM25_07120 [Actinomadura rubteroloni]
MDDFHLWERELTPAEPPEDGRGEALLAGALTVVGCTGLILLGGTAAGVAGLVLAGVIGVLWRCGL